MNIGCVCYFFYDIYYFLLCFVVDFVCFVNYMWYSCDWDFCCFCYIVNCCFYVYFLFGYWIFWLIIFWYLIGEMFFICLKSFEKYVGFFILIVFVMMFILLFVEDKRCFVFVIFIWFVYCVGVMFSICCM